MTLLTRGLKSTGQGLSYIDKAIAKAEKDKARTEQYVDAYSSDLAGMQSSGNFLGGTGRTILQEFSNAYEEALDAFANDPSRENKSRLANIKQQSTDFINIALGARQNSLNQYNAFTQDPSAYSVDSEEALNMFNSVENAEGIKASFDMNTMEMFLGDEDGMNPLASFGYYNGTSPLFYAKKPSVSSIKAEGEWASEHYEQYAGLLNAEGGKEKVIEGFRETGRFDSSGLQDTAIFNYLLDVKRVSKDDPAFLDMLQDVRNNPEELNMALDHMAGLEYQYMLGIHNYNQRAAISKAMADVFRGDTSERTRPEPAPRPDLTSSEDQDVSERPNDGLFGAHFIRQLATPLNTTNGENGVRGLAALGYDRITGLEVDALGQIIVSAEKILKDDMGEEVGIEKIPEFVLDGQDPDNNDLYNNLKAKLMRDGLWSELTAQAMNRQQEWEAREEQASYDRAVAAQDAQAQQEEVERILTSTTTTEEDVRRASTGLNERGRERQAQEEAAINSVRQELAESGFMGRAAGPIRLRRGSGTALGSPIETNLNNAFFDRIIDRGYSADQIRMGVNRMIEDYGRQEVSGFRVGAQSLVRGIFEGLGRVNDEDYTDLKEPLELFEKALAAASSDAANVEADRIREESLSRMQASDIAVTNKRSSEQKDAYTGTMLQLARENGVLFPEVMVAQSAIESSWGRKPAARNNVFGIKYSPTLMEDLKGRGINAFKGDEVGTQEEENGRLVSRRANFMGFGTLEDAVKAYRYLIESRRAYSEARGAENALDYAKALQGTYATDSGYAEKIQNFATDTLGVDLSKILR